MVIKQAILAVGLPRNFDNSEVARRRVVIWDLKSIQKKTANFITFFSNYTIHKHQ